ncbi:hypothetical protein EJD97_020122, partial [Solanum chilense]
KSLRRSPRLVRDIDTSNPKVYRRSRKKRHVSSLLLLMKFQVLVWESHKYWGSITMRRRTMRRRTSKSLKNKDGLEKKKPVNDGKIQNRLSKNVILPESKYPYDTRSE